MSKTEYQPLIKQINGYVEKHNFNDWARYLLVYRLGEKLYAQETLANLFTWFILAKDGYDVRLGYTNQTIYLLAQIKNRLYQMAYLQLDKKNYYILNPSGQTKPINTIYTYKGNYANAIKYLDLDLKQPLKLQSQPVARRLYFQLDKQKLAIDLELNKSFIDFFKTFPQSNYKLYFTSSVEESVTHPLLAELSKLLQQRSETEAINLLLHFVQTSFAYETDEQQFRYEKVLLPEETLFYPYSDCEDRSILFSYLVKRLIGLKMVAIKYPDHLATAVALTNPVSGDSFNYKGVRYTIADPTYINANVGMTMPNYKQSRFEVIEF